jgi:hypothetical protein
MVVLRDGKYNGYQLADTGVAPCKQGVVRHRCRYETVMLSFPDQTHEITVGTEDAPIRHDYSVRWP